MTPAINLNTGAARGYTDQQLGGPTTENESNPTCQISITQLVKNNPDRVGILIMNLGSFDAFIAFNANVGSTNGIKLAANGGIFAANVRDDFTVPAREYSGIASGGATAIYILEIIRLPVASQVGT